MKYCATVIVRNVEANDAYSMIIGSDNYDKYKHELVNKLMNALGKGHAKEITIIDTPPHSVFDADKRL